MRRFQLELIYCPSQETEVTSTPTRPVDNVVITTKSILKNIMFLHRWEDFSYCPSQETEVTSTPTRPVDNNESLQDRNINILDGTTGENKGKLILTTDKSSGNSFRFLFKYSDSLMRNFVI